MVKKCASPGMDHFSSLRWPNTSEICVQTRVPTSSVRPLTGWPESVSLASHSTRRTASKAMIAVIAQADNQSDQHLRVHGATPQDSCYWSVTKLYVTGR